MFRSLLILFSSFLSVQGLSQNSISTLLPKEGFSVSSFIPKGWIKLQETWGDYNYDGFSDVAIVIIDSIQEKVIGDTNRSLVILKGGKRRFVVSGYCDSVILCFGCGGVHGDPFDSIQFVENKLIITQVVGSSYRRQFITSFRFQKGNWVLIGAADKGSFLSAKCKKCQLFGGLFYYEKNFLTGEFVKKNISETDCKVERNERGVEPRKPLIKLKEYNVTSIWNITQ